MKRILILLLLVPALLTACGAEAVPAEEADTGLTVTVYYSPT